MRIKVDEDLPTAATRLLQSKGHDAISVTGQSMGGWADNTLWRAIQAEQRFLVTADKGFADIRSHRPGTHAGILLLRPDEDGIRPLIELLEAVLAAYDLEALATTVAVATPRGIRIRREPAH
jgi:predicted nuclease of predicted toxin-antitoxin system